MTTDREAACWLVAALLVVVLTFGATGCGLQHQTAGFDEPVFVAAAPAARWTVRDEADALPELVAAAERDRARAPGFADTWGDEPAAAVPLFTLEQAAQLNTVGGLTSDVPGPAAAPAAVRTGHRGAEADAATEADADAPRDDDPAVGAVFGADTPGPAAAAGLLTDALDRGWRSAGPAFPAASPGQVALGLTGATLLAFALQVLALASSLRPDPAPAELRLTLGPAPVPFPRPPAGGAARPLPFPRVAAFGGPRLARAA